MITRLGSVFRVGFVVILLLATDIGQAFSQGFDSQADAHFRARWALDFAATNGYDVNGVTAAQLGDLLHALETTSFVDAPVEDVQLSASTKRYKCSKTNWFAGHKLKINWWADARVSSGRIREVISTGYNWEWVTWIPTLDAVVDATVTAYIKDSGRKIKIYIDGTVKWWFAGLPISTRALNASCTKNA